MQLGAREGGFALAVGGLAIPGAFGVYTGLITRVRELEKERWLNTLLSSLGMIFMMYFPLRPNFRWNGWQNRESCLWMS